nr:unnamed protein product [Spirometra erinaceieuropaei]
MFFGGGAGYRQIINVDVDKWQAAKHSVYEPLKGLGDVAEPKRYAEELQEAKRNGDGRLLNVLWDNANSVESTD